MVYDLKVDFLFIRQKRMKFKKIKKTLSFMIFNKDKARRTRRNSICSDL